MANTDHQNTERRRSGAVGSEARIGRSKRAVMAEALLLVLTAPIVLAAADAAFVHKDNISRRSHRRQSCSSISPAFVSPSRIKGLSAAPSFGTASITPAYQTRLFSGDDDGDTDMDADYDDDDYDDSDLVIDVEGDGDYDDFDDDDDDDDFDDDDDDEEEDIVDRENNDDRSGEMTKRHDVVKVKVVPVPDKIFAIGFKKTGTSSLNLMYEPLIDHFGGTRPKGNGKAARNVAEEKSREVVERDALKLAAKHTYFQGSPWCAEPHRLWETLAVAYPTSRFVLTTRDPDAWYDSILRYVDCDKSTGKKTSACGDEKLEKYRILFGADGTSRREFQDAMESHNAAIRSRFEDEPHRLLEIDLTSTNSASPSKVWEVFCEFAGLPADRCPTDREIPHENKQSAAGAAGAAEAP